MLKIYAFIFCVFKYRHQIKIRIYNYLLSTMILRSLNNPPKYKVSVREIINSNYRSPPSKQSEDQLPISKYPPSHIEKQDSQSFDATPVNSNLFFTEQPKRQRKKIFKKNCQRRTQEGSGKKDNRKSVEKSNSICQQCRKRSEQKSTSKFIGVDFSHESKNQGFAGISQEGDNLYRSNGESGINSTYRTLQTKNENKAFFNQNFLTSSCHQTPTLKNLDTFHPQKPTNIPQNSLNESHRNSNHRSTSPKNYPSPVSRDQKSPQRVSRVIYDQLNMKKSPSFAPSQVSHTISLQKACELEQRIFNHDEQISDLRNKIQQMKKRNNEQQRMLLKELIKKQQSLCSKQSQLNHQLQKALEIQNQNQLRNEQIIRRQLELQRQRRIQELTKQNERLCQNMITKDSIKKEDLITPITNMNIQGNISGNLSPFQHFQFFKDNNHHSISALQPYRYDESDDEDNTIGQLLSPFALNPDDL